MKSGRLLLFLTLLLSAQTAILAQPRDVMLVLDNSGSMKRHDPARLTVSAVQDFIARQGVDTRIGIILFADNPRLIAPLTPVTEDARMRLLSKLDQLNYSGRWTETADAMERAIYELRVNGRPAAGKAIILMTDGILDTGNAARDLERSAWLRNSLVLEAQRNNTHIFGLAFTEEADYQLLQFMAQATGGEYFRALSATDLSPVLARIDSAIAATADTTFVYGPAQQAQAQVPAPTSRQDNSSTPAVQVAQEPQRLVYSGPDEDNKLAESSQDGGKGSGFGLVSWLGLLLLALILAVGAGIAWLRGRMNLAELFGKPVESASVDHGPRAVLYDVHDPSDIKRHELASKPIVIGRVSGSDPAMDYIVVDERTVGRWHATIERRGQSFWIRDEGSVNGTFVNEQRVSTEHPLKHGDMVRVHRHEFEFVIPELFDSDRTMVANEGDRARAEEEARKTATATG